MDDWTPDVDLVPKVSSEDQKRLLDIKVRLEDGGFGHVFSVKKADNSLRWRCHLCDVVIMGQHHVDSHIQSKKHQVQMATPMHKRVLFSRIDGNKEYDVPTLAPGEPIPPGFEDKVVVTREAAQIQPTLDRNKTPLMGLEYLVELNPNEEGNEPQYICILCDKRGDPRVAMAHLTSFNHRSKYLGINFPKASRAIAVSLPRSKEGRRGYAEIVSKICSKIEEKYGRRKPMVLNVDEYEHKKDFYRMQIESDLHFRETTEANFVDVVGSLTTTYSINLDEVPLPMAEPAKKEDTKRKVGVDRSSLRPHAGTDMDKIEDKEDDAPKKANSPEKKVSNNSDKAKRTKKSNSLSSISSVSSSSLSRSPSPSRSRSKSKTRSKSPSPLTRRHSWHRSSDRYGSRYGRRRSHSRGRSPLYRKNRSRSRSDSKGRGRSSFKKVKVEISHERNEKRKWEKFREELDAEERDLIKTLKYHEKNPEKHPMYPEEWKKFWNKRYKELQAEGGDPSSHDYKPEWIEFWNKRMREMHQQSLLEKKEELRLKYDLPKEEPPPPVIRYRPPKRQYPVETDDDVIILLSPGKNPKPKFWKSKDERLRNRSPSPWDNEESYRYHPSRVWYNQKSGYPDGGRSRSGGSSRGTYRHTPAKPHYREDDPFGESIEPVKVITVLRLLTAMESQLGSIGPTVNDLLASALAMEKSRPGSSEALLGNSDNLITFETVKEKLKGQLFAGIVEQGLLLATRSCIQNIAEIVYRASKMAKEPVVQAPAVATPNVAAMTVPGVGAVDKAAIAQQIAAALVAQGKTDVTHEELEQLINAVVGMAHASAVMDEPITTAAFASMQKTSRVEAKPTAPTVMSPVPPRISPPLVGRAPSVEEQSPLERLLSVVHSTTKVEQPTVSAPLFPCVDVAVSKPTAPSISLTPTNDKDPSPGPQKINISVMKDLNESDLKELLQNFKDLSRKEQHYLIAYLKNLEATNPDRVEKLRKFVTFIPLPVAPAPELPTVKLVDEYADREVNEESKSFEKSGRLSPFSMRMGSGGANPLGGANPAVDEPFGFKKDAEEDDKKLSLDDSDDDYSFEDIYAAASKKVSEKEKAKEEEEAAAKLAAAKLIDVKKPSPGSVETDHTANILRETKLMIANLMGQLPTKFNQKKMSPISLIVNTTTPNPTITTPTKPIITTPTRVELPIRNNLGLNIDISNTLTEAESSPTLSTTQSSGINVVSSHSHRPIFTPVPVNVNPCPSPGPLTPNSNSHSSNYTIHSNNYSEPYNQQPFPEAQQPETPNFSVSESYRPQPQLAYQENYPNQAYPQNYPNEYGDSYNSYYGGNTHPQQNPHYPHNMDMGYPQQEGYSQEVRPVQPPQYREPGPPQRYPNQYPGRGYNQYPNNPQGYY